MTWQASESREVAVVTDESFRVAPVAHVVGGRAGPTDDYRDGTRSIIRIDRTRFTSGATRSLESFSHLEVVFRLHFQDQNDPTLGARRPRDNPAWPDVGIFGHRDRRRINWLGVSRCRLIRVDGLDLHVEDLDAVDGTPVLDIKPWLTEPTRPGETLVDYFRLSAAVEPRRVSRSGRLPAPRFPPDGPPWCGR